MQFTVKGKAKQVKTEAIRGILHACDTVLSYHGLHPTSRSIFVGIVNRKQYLIAYGEDTDSVGFACHSTGEMYVMNNKDLNSTITILIHEMIHLYLNSKYLTTPEKVTSTLVNRLKDDIIRVANILTENCYKRAGYIAHTKISYPATGEDYYDSDQYTISEEMIKNIMLRKEKINV